MISHVLMLPSPLMTDSFRSFTSAVHISLSVSTCFSEYIREKWHTCKAHDSIGMRRLGTRWRRDNENESMKSRWKRDHGTGTMKSDENEIMGTTPWKRSLVFLHPSCIVADFYTDYLVIVISISVYDLVVHSTWFGWFSQIVVMYTTNSDVQFNDIRQWLVDFQMGDVRVSTESNCY